MKDGFNLFGALGAGYRRDAKIFAQYTDMELSKEHFDRYAQSGTLQSVMKQADKDCWDEYGIPLQIGRAMRLSAILGHLSDNGIVFDLADDNNKPLLERMKKTAMDYMAQNRYPKMPEAYKNNPELVGEVNKLRKKLLFPPVISL